jgi:hypothetical protein
MLIVKWSLHEWFSAEFKMEYFEAVRVVRELSKRENIFSTLMDSYLEYYHGSWIDYQHNEQKEYLKKTGEAMI